MIFLKHLTEEQIKIPCKATCIRNFLNLYLFFALVSLIYFNASLLMHVYMCWELEHSHTGDSSTLRQVIRNAPVGSCDLMLFENYNCKKVNLLLNLKKDI